MCGVYRRNEILPVNEGTEWGDYTKEHMWAGPTDRKFGEFYKKMNMNEEKLPHELILFYNFWNMWRKLIIALSIVYFESNFGF